MKRFALIQLRAANLEDFRTLTTAGKYVPKYHVPYLEQHFSGKIDNKVKYLTEQTDKTTFKLLFEANQIWVFANPNEVQSTFNCIDWHFIDKELDYEIQELEKIVTKNKPKK